MGQPEFITDNADQRDFWDSLQMDMYSLNQKLSIEDYRAYIERGFMFSLFFRGFSTTEIIGYQKILNLKDIGYVIMLEFSEFEKSGASELLSDEFILHHYIKKSLQGFNCALGPLVSNRLAILITHDETDHKKYKEESHTICHMLLQALEKYYKTKIHAGIGNTYNIHSIYSSFIDSIVSLYHDRTQQIVYYPDLKRIDTNGHFDYQLYEKYLMEAVRLRKAEAFDYFGLIMDNVRYLNDEMKRNKILEILVLAHHSKDQDNDANLKQIDYIENVQKLMGLTGNQLIEFAYKAFHFITNYVRPQKSIDYSNHIVMATKEYIENHYVEDITLENMAEYVNISPQYFSKLIKKTTGFNFIDWLSMFRVKKAKELLTNSNLSVKEVCFMVGYKDPNYFSRIFKKRVGITPSEFVQANSNVSNMN